MKIFIPPRPTTTTTTTIITYSNQTPQSRPYPSPPTNHSVRQPIINCTSQASLIPAPSFYCSARHSLSAGRHHHHHRLLLLFPPLAVFLVYSYITGFCLSQAKQAPSRQPPDAPHCVKTVTKNPSKSRCLALADLSTRPGTEANERRS
ncbi:hypothetical protein E2C01_051306 [Portunus trituberculatus]|uniref:Uncharacterized protein n=1 Tax=Portunus trituberculatus TaxID=210409 RepID=A0A5B7GJY5_PORTR|nr:hypothetical protein [Portunus trituberculatus]